MAARCQSNPVWYRLDNAAKLYPAVREVDWGAVFRVACYFDEPVEPGRLQDALERTIRRFPLYAVALRRGVFWYYHERLPGCPRVAEEAAYPCVMPDAMDNESFLFRILYYRNRLSVEFFHSLADGTGALTFLKTLAAEYLERGGTAIPPAEGILPRTGTPAAEETEDAFRRYAGDPRGGSFRETQAYELPFPALPLPYLRVVHGTVDLDAARAVARAHGCTITALLAAVLALSFDTVQRDDEGMPQHPVKISVPVNMRAYHPSRTLRNFSLFANVPLPLGEYPPDIDTAIAAMRDGMREGLEQERLDRMMALNVNAERNPALRAMPLFIKRLALRAANALVGENQFTCSLSNLGAIALPPEMAAHVTRFDFVLGRSRTPNVNCAVAGYDGRLVVSLSSSVAEHGIEREFFDRLAALGIGAELESNDAATGGATAYPPPAPLPAKAERLRRIDRVTGSATALASLFLVFINLVTGGAPWWPYPVGALLAAFTLWRGLRTVPCPRVPHCVLLGEAVSVAYLGLLAFMTGTPGWFIGYLVPSVILAALCGLTVLAVVDRRPFKKAYVPLTVNLVAGIAIWPLSILAGPGTERVYPAIVAFLSAVELAATAYLGRRWWTNELRRKLDR